MITPELKKIIADAKSSLYFQAKLLCDGKEVTIRKVKAGECSMVYEIYLDGVVRGEWFLSDDQENRALVKKYYPTKKTSIKYFDKLSKRKPNHVEYWSPIASSISKIIRHLLKTCTSVEVLNT